MFTATKEMMQNIALERRKRAGIPRRYLDAQVDPDCKHKKMARAHVMGKAYLGKFDQLMSDGVSMVMCGGVGTGKTHLACAVAGTLAERGHKVKYQKLISMITDVRSAYNRESSRTRQDIVDEYISPDLLVLDEIGVQSCTADEMGIIYEILDGRYDQARPVIVIGNLTLKDMEKMIGERCVSRLKDKGGVQIIFDWEDLRG